MCLGPFLFSLFFLLTPANKKEFSNGIYTFPSKPTGVGDKTQQITSALTLAQLEPLWCIFLASRFVSLIAQLFPFKVYLTPVGMAIIKNYNQKHEC